MKLTRPKAELLLQKPDADGIYRMVERCGRTCYRSEDKMTEGSARPFVDRMVKAGHTSMLEHGTVYLKIPYNAMHRLTHYGLCKKYRLNPYSKTRRFTEFVDQPSYDDPVLAADRYLAVTTNLRVLVENGWLDDLKYLCEPTDWHERRYTFRLTTDRGVSHELCRHRKMSFAQESTRYCNYSKDKFGNSVTFIKPDWFCARIKEFVTSAEMKKILQKEEYTFCSALYEAETVYRFMLKRQFTPQEARAILPNALKTEVCMTGFASDWRHFFDLRLFGKAGSPHPDMKALAALMKEEAQRHGIWEGIMRYPSRFDG